MDIWGAIRINVNLSPGLSTLLFKLTLHSGMGRRRWKWLTSLKKLEMNLISLEDWELDRARSIFIIFKHYLIIYIVFSTRFENQFSQRLLIILGILTSHFDISISLCACSAWQKVCTQFYWVVCARRIYLSRKSTGHTIELGTYFLPDTAAWDIYLA